ncbi:hypothetical protein [Anaplasma capra]|nr:hypothetical protein [Anaplasma capra]MCU7611453.1 hypothetical protein [Anaplasma capra]MCU7612108.1 hypothetical protein [Anaplasma capra]
MGAVYLAYSLSFAVLFSFAAFLVNDYRKAKKTLEEIVAMEDEEEA